MVNLEKDIKEAKNIAWGFNRTKKCTEYSKCFLNTSENIKGYMKYLDGDYKKALLPTSSGDHILEAMLSGITDITCYDINNLAKYFAKLKLGAIKSLSKEEFLNYMYEDLLNKEVLNYIKDNLDDNTYLFWNELFNRSSKEDIYYRLFRLMGIYDNRGNVINDTEFSKYCAERFTTYLDDNNYKTVQEQLGNTKIKYIDSDILNLNDSLDNTYDLINLTNIYEYINDNPYGDGAGKFAKCVLSLIDKLNEDGKILLTYLYKYNEKDFKKYSNKTINYLTFLRYLMATPIGKSNYNYNANRHGRRTLMDKCYAFRSTQFIQYLKGLNIEAYEIQKVGLGRLYYPCNTDTALVYTKKINH